MRLSTLLLLRSSTFLLCAVLCVGTGLGCTSGTEPSAEAPALPGAGGSGAGGSGAGGSGTGGSGDAAPSLGDTDLPPEPVVPCPDASAVVRFETADGVTLAADLLVPESSQGVAILVHMIPPNFDRSSYPPRVREAIAALGYTVLTLDRRGAGESGGNAVDAYEGEGGRLDLEAAVRFLQTFPEACGIAVDRLALVGASNGTTSVLDYLVGRDPALPEPTAIAWLSPGDYTENQHTVASVMDTLAATRLLIVHPSSEPWATQFAVETPASWDVLELADGQHGTRNFDGDALEARTVEALTALLQQ